MASTPTTPGTPKPGTPRGSTATIGGGTGGVQFIPVDDPDGVLPDFIYGGPFIKVEKPGPFIDAATPINIECSGVFKKSYAYNSLTERMPVILTKIIDYLARDGGSIKSSNNASEDDLKNLMQIVTKLKNDLMTNKNFDKFDENPDKFDDVEEPMMWNEWMNNLSQKKYYTATWLWTECYIYRKLAEGLLASTGLRNFDYFGVEKAAQLSNSMEPICMVGEKVSGMLSEKPKDQKKVDFIMLMKICLWANKCDLSLTLGEENRFTMPDIPPEQPKPEKKGAKPSAVPAKPLAPGVSGADRDMDPIAMILEMKDKLLVDDSGKIFEALCTKTEKIRNTIAGPADPPPEPAAAAAGAAGGAAASPVTSPKATTPCATKLTIPACVMFDIVCANVGYDLFTDLCLGTFLIKQNLVQKVRFHVKKYPWFLSDVTQKDFRTTIASLKTATFSKETKTEVKPGATPAEGEPASTSPVTAGPVNELAAMWEQWLEDGIFLVMSDSYWTYPHPYCDMKKLDYWLYRKLQFPAAIMFKGDLNYRKLIAEKNTNPISKLDAGLQGFNPTSLIAVRTIKSDIVCGLPKNRWEQLNALDPMWMRKGLYGVIQFVPKAEALKVSDRPCPDYGTECRGAGCPHWRDYYGADPEPPKT